MSDSIQGPFIVTGASGQLGRQVVENLLAKGANPVVAITRTPDKLADLRARGVEVPWIFFAVASLEPRS